ncbi:MAG: eda [Verrucomicrobiaceae bacterium]|nr:eda [Verrucomicrobiaceae bacterium]
MYDSVPEALLSHLYRTGIIAVLMIDHADDAVPLAEALLAGGVDCMELTLRTNAAMEALARIRAEVPQMTAGVGTILTPKQVHQVAEAKAAFGVSPGVNSSVIAESRRHELPFAPGICTPTDIESALELGCRLLKFFPAEPCGGLPYLKAIAAPYAHLSLRYIPLGGVDETNAAKYLAEPIIQAIGGSWLAPREVIQRKDWATVTENARRATAIVQSVRGGKA